MTTGHSKRRRSYVVLCAGLVLVIALFGVRAQYTSTVYYSLVAVQLTVLCIAAWKLGASAVCAEAERRRCNAVAGVLLIMPWVLFSWLAGFGAPWLATAAENQLRYLVLLINAMVVAGGLIVLKEALSDAGEHFYSPLGFAAILLATPLYLIWATILLYEWSARVRVGSEPLPAGLIMMSAMSDYLLFFGGVLTYIASAAFAAALGRTQWLGRRAARGFVVASCIAVVCLVVRGPTFPSPKAVAEHWYDIPGFVVGIPAVPWIMPMMFGVALLRRAGDKSCWGQSSISGDNREE